MSYLDDLARELRASGICKRRRARILAEFADHLRCDPKAELGEPGRLAAQFADELGTALARKAAFTSFAALALAGALVAGGFFTGQTRSLATLADVSGGLGYAGAGMALIGCQVAFVAGVLAALRALRRRRAGILPRQETVMIVRRAAVGLAAGILTMLGFGLVALALRHHAASWWTTLALASSGAGMLALVAAAPTVVMAARLRPVAAGSAGDLNEDFGPLVPRPLRGNPWRFALAVAAAVAVVIAVAGVVQSDPYDGALRGLADGAAGLLGFAVLGRYLGLRR